MNSDQHSAYTMDEDQESNTIAVIQINAGGGEDAEIIFEFGPIQIDVSFFASPRGPDRGDVQREALVEDQLIRILDQAAVSEDVDDYEAATDEVLDHILRSGEPLFIQASMASSLQASKYEGRDLHSQIYPSRFHFRFQTIDGRPVVFPIRPDEACTIQDADPIPPSELGFEICD
jgi:hypothetical protein